MVGDLRQFSAGLGSNFFREVEVGETESDVIYTWEIKSSGILTLKPITTTCVERFVSSRQETKGTSHAQYAQFLKLARKNLYR
jgi:hypothetical protein